MPNRTLTPLELAHANELLSEIRQRLAALSAGDAELEFALRRKIAKELGYDERSKPMIRGPRVCTMMSGSTSPASPSIQTCFRLLRPARLAAFSHKQPARIGSFRAAHAHEEGTRPSV